ncbi:hypothetical protein CEQ07_08265 [Oligella urethralis]|uniref:formate dehydrogenase subunit delta n=1 Tax=Oligella urethralis TaxID=90245 RepID=UPI000CFF3342|nr:formate dehydrogenase subunit delta [Oligella urethralis]AVL71407.1 hypothetical protein CEQ07_08265 [Oligella urethralis]
MPDQSKATADMARHIRAFWDPRMRESMSNFLQQNPNGKSAQGHISDFAVKAYNHLLKNLP